MLSTIALLNQNGRAHHGVSRRNGFQPISEPDQTLGLLIGHVPYLCDYCVRGCQYPFAPAPHVPPFSPRVGEEGGEGEGEGRQACSAAPVLKPLRRRMRCPPTFP
jgi:hypothetical protein